MARSLVCRQRCAEAGQASTQSRGTTIACPTSVPSVIRILNGANIVCGGEERAERRRVRTNDRRFIRTVDEQR